jgi:hypothetical protein
MTCYTTSLHNTSCTATRDATIQVTDTNPINNRLQYFPFNKERKPTPFHINTLFPKSEKKQFAKTEEKLRECDTTQVDEFRSITVASTSPAVSGRPPQSERHLLVVRGRLADPNPYHSMAMDPSLFCTYLYSSVSHPSATVDLFIEDAYFPTDGNTLEILQALLAPGNGSIHTPLSPPPEASYQAISTQRSAISSESSLSSILIPSSSATGAFVSTFPLWGSWGFEEGRLHDPKISAFADTVKRNLGVLGWSAAGSGSGTSTVGNVLLVDRVTDRLLGGYRKAALGGGYSWGRQGSLDASIRARGVPVSSMSFGPSAPTRSIVSAVAGARVVVAVHGAGLTHAMWMERGSVLIEVVNRIPEYYGEEGDTRGYHKGDFANLARAFGITYYYKDSGGIVAKEGGDFNWETSLVDLDEFTDQVERAYRDTS